VLLIPGTGNRGHLAENLAAASLSLHHGEVAGLSTAFGEPGHAGECAAPDGT
jgi:diketogulonate reductase-like aldo/keto reductase